ncbi:RING-H2 zinc finger family protein [Leishmania donovani]|uniref:RING-type E3 ubiquitin transferase n=1 Tax=Leishmania donovani TaxID=5661 RepID=A0A504Y1G5_LEIDO|nr:RING-H2 zinc finger family protein [Leishmania donovani]
MPKRGRANSTDASYAAEHGVVEVSDADSPATQPIGVEEMMESQRDPLLEQQLDALEVDEDFRESIRAMTPNTRRDVLNDIIRHQQHTEIEESLMRGFHGGDFGSAGPLFTFGAGIPPGMHQHAAAEEDEEAETGSTVERPPFLLRGMAMGSIDNTGMPHVQHRGGQSPQQAGAPPTVLDILRLIAGHSTPQARSRGGDGLHHQGRGSGQRTAFEEGMMNLHNLIGVLQQANVMQSMGLDHDIDDMTYEELLELEERIGNVSKGVPPALLDSCMACVKLLNCPHAFHKPCINQWLTQNKTCPICKMEVLPKPAPSSS